MYCPVEKFFEKERENDAFVDSIEKKMMEHLSEEKRGIVIGDIRWKELDDICIVAYFKEGYAIFCNSKIEQAQRKIFLKRHFPDLNDILRGQFVTFVLNTMPEAEVQSGNLSHGIFQDTRFPEDLRMFVHWDSFGTAYYILKAKFLK